MPGSFSVIYRADIITELDQNWHFFADENWGSAQRRPKVLGTSLWGHICDPTTVYLYKEMLALVRAQNRTMSFDFRCDSAQVKRFMQMRLIPLRQNRIEFKSTLMREEPLNPHRSSKAKKPDDPIAICSWCKKARVTQPGQAETWQELDRAACRLGVFNCLLPAEITHTICSDCHQGLSEQIAECKDKT